MARLVELTNGHRTAERLRLAPTLIVRQSSGGGR
jgi:hypothetical protein